MVFPWLRPAARAGTPAKTRPCVHLLSRKHRQPFLTPLATHNPSEGTFDNSHIFSHSR